VISTCQLHSFVARQWPTWGSHSHLRRVCGAVKHGPAGHFAALHCPKPSALRVSSENNRQWPKWAVQPCPFVTLPAWASRAKFIPCTCPGQTVSSPHAICKCSASLSPTRRPFGVNLTLLPALKPPNYDAYAQVVEDEGIPVVETAGHYKVRQWWMS
jgi:hypothetical protein